LGGRLVKRRFEEVAFDDGDGVRELARLRVGFGEEEAQEAALAELTSRPDVSRDALRAGAEAVRDLESALGRRRPEADVGERTAR